MSDPPQPHAAMPATWAELATATWADLATELDRWGEAGRTAALWWRDDDAVASTPALETLLRIAGHTPLALAVIPAVANPELAEALATRRQVAVLQHGWRHANRAGSGRKSEYPPGLALPLAGEEIGAGRARLDALFGAKALPIFVPPWNRLADEFLPLLPPLGIVGLSAMASRRAPPLPPGLRSLDVHLDLVAWSGNRGFIGEEAALAGLVRRLQGRRNGEDPAADAIGILTHHLIMDDGTAAFLERLIALTTAHPAVRWAAIGDLLSFLR